MKKKSIIALLCTTMLLSGCGANPDNSAAPEDQTPSKQTNTADGNEAGSPTADGQNLFGSADKDKDSSNNSGSTDKSTDSNSDNADDSYTKSLAIDNSVSVASYSDMFTDRDARSTYDAASAVGITLSGNSASCSSSSVTVNGSTVTICAEGTYVISGTLDDGMIIVDTDKNTKVQLVLAGVSIHKSDSAAIYIKKADKVFLTLADGTKNTLSGGDHYTAIDENNIDAVIFSKDDLTLNGGGSLSVSAAAGHGIVSKNDLVFTGGSYEINAADHGLTGKDSIRVADGNFTITAGKDGLHADNDEDAAKGFLYLAGGNFTITASGDGIDASASLTVTGGSFTITSGGGTANAPTHANNDFGGRGWSFGGTSGSTSDTSASTKGIKATNGITITGGSFTINSADDALHSNTGLCIAGGSFSLASGDDGIHADDALVILDGTLAITESYEGIEGKTIEISGGDIALRAKDDGLNAAGGNDESGFGGFGWGRDSFASQDGVHILISGGSLKIDADGDGIDSNGSLTVTGGTIYVDGPTNSGNGALDKNGTASISGGTVVALGAAGMAETFDSSSTQGSILINTSSAHAAGTVVELLDASGNTLVSYTSRKSFSSVVISDPSVTVGNRYTLKVGTETKEITMETISYGASGTGGFGGGFNRPGKNGGGKQNWGGFDETEPNRNDMPDNVPGMDGNNPPDGTDRPEMPGMDGNNPPDGATPPDGFGRMGGTEV